MNDLYKYINYSNPRNIIISKKIYEYDIKQANISVLYAQGKLSEYDYEKLSHSDKFSREVFIGKMIANSDDSTINASIQNGIREAKRQFIFYNQISEESIVRIANDAIYCIRDYPIKHRKFRINENNNFEIEFIQKNCYDGYVHFSNDVWAFYKILPNDNVDSTVIGLGNYSFIHGNMISIISIILYYLHKMQYDIAIRHLSATIENYLRKELPIETYREFNPSGIFCLKKEIETGIGTYFSLFPTNVSSNLEIDQLDISYNYAILRELYAMVLSLKTP